jgi:excisionase family DNA binding protein
MTDLVGTPAEVASRLGCCEATVRRLIAEGRLPHVKLSPKKPVVSWAALNEWLASESAASLNGHEEAS